MKITIFILAHLNVQKIKKMTTVSKKNKKPLILPGHNACAGCGQLSAVQAVMRGLNENIIIANATGCLEVTTTAHPHSSWNVPWIHSLFENSAAVASGIFASLKYRGNKNTKVIVQAGDGATFDIGLGFISGLWERNEDILYICYDTESYSNTGVQASGATPYGAHTTTTPKGLRSIGADQNKKDMIAIALAHKLKYVAQSTAGHPDDITVKVKKALASPGPSYLQILSPCVLGWGAQVGASAQLGKLAASTGLYPLLEYSDGVLTNSNIHSNFKADKVEAYLKLQSRFSHLGKAEINAIQAIANYNLKKYRLNK